MFDKFLLAIFIAGFSSINVLTLKAVAQEPPECYIVDDTGELEDLTDICDASQKRSPDSNSTTTQGENVVNNNININNSDLNSGFGKVSVNDGFVVGADNSSVNSGIDSSYLIDNEPGLDYTAYVRRYQTSLNSFDYLTRREQIFQFDNRFGSHTRILREGRSELPFLIYRYQN